MPTAKTWNYIAPLVLAALFTILTCFNLSFLVNEGHEDKSYYNSTHVTQTRIKGDNLANSSTAQIVFGLDAVAFLEPMPTQRALLGSDEKNTFFESCIGVANKSAKTCADEGTVPYLVINGISGQSFYLTGAHNSRILLCFFTYYLAGALAMVSAFVRLNANLFPGDDKPEPSDKTTSDPDTTPPSAKQNTEETLERFTLYASICCVIYLLIPVFPAYFTYNRNESRNGASTFYGLLSIFSVVFSFLWSFVPEKRRIMFLNSEFGGQDKNAERTPLLPAEEDNGNGGGIIIPGSMRVSNVKSSSVKMNAIYSTEKTKNQNVHFDVETFETIPFVPTNTFILKSMIPLFFLWAMVVKSRQATGLDVDLQLYTIGLTVFAFNNYIYKKSFAFVSYTYAWLNSKSDTIPESNMNVVETYFQIILSSMLIQLLIIVSLWIYDTPFNLSLLFGPIYLPMFFILIFDFVSVIIIVLPRFLNYTDDDKGFLKWVFDRDILYAGGGTSGAARETQYIPLGAPQFYSICMILFVHIIILWVS